MAFRIRRQGGFTLIGFLILIAILGMIAAVVALGVAGFLGSNNTTEVLQWELIAEGVLVEFDVSDKGWRIRVDDRLFLVDSQHETVEYDNPVLLNRYCYLYDVARSPGHLGGYQLVQEELDGI